MRPLLGFVARILAAGAVMGVVALGLGTAVPWPVALVGASVAFAATALALRCIDQEEMRMVRDVLRRRRERKAAGDVDGQHVPRRGGSARLRGVLLEWVSEILVVDMGSDDGTIELARELGARVLEVPPAGFAEPGRQAGIDAARQPWVLVLDADERAAPGLRDLVAAAVERPDLDGVRLNRENHLFGKAIHSAGFWPDRQLRLFRPGKTHWPPLTHTQAQVTGKVENGPGDEAAIVHYAYDSIGEWVTRGNRYTDHDLVRYAAKGRSASLLRLLLLPPARFAWYFVVKRGYRDGRHGLVLCMLLAWYAAIVELKLWDKERADG